MIHLFKKGLLGRQPTWKNAPPTMLWRIDATHHAETRAIEGYSSAQQKCS